MSEPQPCGKIASATWCCEYHAIHSDDDFAAARQRVVELEAALAIGALIEAAQARPLEFDDTVARLCEVAKRHGWRLKSWGLQRIIESHDEA